MKDKIKNIFLIILGIGLIALGIYTYNQCKTINAYKSKLETASKNDSHYEAIYKDAEFKSLKDENKTLYDSLKHKQDQIDFLVQFNYKKNYSSGKVIVKEKEVEDTLVVNTYEYSNEKNDSINYNLKIGSTTEPNWYELKFSLNDKITLTNERIDDNNKVTISSQNGATISDGIIYHQKEKKGFWKRISVGPTVTGGYDVINKRMGVMVGVGVTYDLTNK